MKRLSAAEIEQMTPLIGTVSDADLGRRFGVTRARVHQIRVARGIAVAPKKPRPLPPPPLPLPHYAIATMLRDTRVAASLSQGGLAAKMGIAAAYVSLVEAGKRQPSIDVLHAWADACGRDLSLTMTPR